jgi:hypothetical protein
MRRRFLPALLLGLVAAPMPAVPARAQASLEYAVKAAYLVKFAPFIAWPESAFASANAPLIICVTGDDPFGAELDRAAANQRDGEHPIQLRRMAQPDPACQILFADGADADAALATVKDKPVLTVTDSSAGTKGIIAFVVAQNHVRFDIDEAEAEAAGLKISSKLLDLARAVKKGARP